MWQNILQLVDQPLYDHLVRLTILPSKNVTSFSCYKNILSNYFVNFSATFGVNWTKLLFTRQITDFYHVWDTVIVSKFMLVDYIVVAMVKHDKLILKIKDKNC